MKMALFCLVSIADKQLAPFMGRPPALSRRYTTSKISLDLSDARMMPEGQELDEIKRRLDPDGWNTSGQVYPSIVSRAWMTMALTRDVILELLLGPPTKAYDTETRRK